MSWVTGSFDDDLDGALPQRQPAPDDLLVVVEELDHQVLVGVRPAEQGLALLLLEVRQGERRVAVELDVLALEDEGLAGGALAFLAAVHELDALLGGGAQDRLVLVDLDLDADRLEPDDVLVTHEDPVLRCDAAERVGQGVGRGRAGRAGPPPSPDPRSGVGRCRSAGRALAVVVGDERVALRVAHLVEEDVRAQQRAHRRMWSSVHIFLGSRSRCGCAVMVLPSSRTKPMSATTSAQFQPW